MNRVNRNNRSYNNDRRNNFNRKDEIRRVQQSLPVFRYKKRIIQTVKENPITLIVGETGSGKTTQIPQYLLEWEEVSSRQKVVCTQPRTLAATSVARRVAEEQGESKVGETVGHHIRLDCRSGHKTKLEYMTEGILLRKAQSSGNLGEYKVVIVDEAHERTVNADLLMGFLKKMVKERCDLRVIIMSATLDVKRFSDYFESPPLIEVPGSTNPVQHHWLTKPTEHYLDVMIQVIKAIHCSADSVEIDTRNGRKKPDGDILVFLTGKNGIEEAHRKLKDLRLKSKDGFGLEVNPLYSALSEDQRAKALEKTRDPMTRKCVLATNIAETSLTIPNVVYVVDCGLSKQKVYSPSKGVEILGVRGISKASVKQRVGRAGRVKPGVAYHLYTRKGYVDFPNETPAEILRSGLVSEVLSMLALGINNPLKFDFIDPPDEMTMARALHILRNLGAVDHNCRITQMGRGMAQFPVPPPMAKSLWMAHKQYDCVHELITIAAMMEMEDRIWWKPSSPDQRADFKKTKSLFYHSGGDHLTLLNVFNAYSAVKHSGDPHRWARDHYLNAGSLRRVDNIRKQYERNLTRVIQRSYEHNGSYQNIQVVFKVNRPDYSKYYENILKALLNGHFMNIAVKGFGEHFWRFRLVSLDASGRDKAVDIVDKAKAHKSSIFEKNKSPNWVMFDDVEWTHSPMLKIISAIKPAWLYEIEHNGYFDVEALKNDQTPIAEALREAHPNFRANFHQL